MEKLREIFSMERILTEDEVLNAKWNAIITGQPIHEELDDIDAEYLTESDMEYLNETEKGPGIHNLMNDINAGNKRLEAQRRKLDTPYKDAAGLGAVGGLAIGGLASLYMGIKKLVQAHKIAKSEQEKYRIEQQIHAKRAEIAKKKAAAHKK